MRTVLGLVCAGSLLAGCGGDDGASDGAGPHIVVTTGILGDVVEHLVGGSADVEVLMPPNADPHDFAPSARQAASLRAADAVVINGLGFEEGLLDTIEAAADEGVQVIVASDAIEPRPLPDGHDHDADGEPEDEDRPDDPHWFTDPVRMQAAVAHMADQLVAAVPDLDARAIEGRSGDYLQELERLDADVGGLLAAIPEGDRLLVTNHEVLGYFADRYDLEVLGAIVPGGSTLAEPSASELADLAREIDEHAVPAIFVETSSPSRLADALAAEGADVTVVELYGESLGEPGSPGDTYVGMVRTNADRIAAALT